MSTDPKFAPRGRCEHCNKVVYPSKYAADQAARRNRRKHLRDGPMQAYRCTAGKWHIGHGSGQSAKKLRRKS